MRIKKVIKKVQKQFHVLIDVKLTDQSIILSGTMDNWEDIVKVGYLFVDPKKKRYVVNDIKLKNYHQSTEENLIIDKKLDNLKVDVLVIGGGIIGSSIIRELSKYKLNLLLIEKEADVAMGASGANDGVIHPGIDLKKSSKKAKYCLLGNKMYDDLSKELNFQFRRISQYVISSDKLDKKLLYFLLYKAKRLGIKGVRMLKKEELYKIEPSTYPWANAAVELKTTGIISPYKTTIAFIENAIMNNAKVSLETKCLKFEVTNHEITQVYTNRGIIYPKVVINCAGVYADDIAELAGDRYYSIHPRKGTDIILDKKVKSYVNTIISKFPKDLKKMKTKGGAIISTIDDNLLIGPDAIEVIDKDNTDTTIESINHVFEKHHNVINKIKKSDIIAYFSGIRAATYEEDYIVEASKKIKNFIHVAGIQSPGLSSAPAIALDVSKMAIEILSKETVIKRNELFNPIRKPIPIVKEMDDNERNLLIKNNPDYGKIICRCEEISLGEIKDAIHSILPATTVDMIKRRVRPGMGRCQGGFCLPLILKILSQELNLDLTTINKSGINTNYGLYKTKENRFIKEDKFSE